MVEVKWLEIYDLKYIIFCKSIGIWKLKFRYLKKNKWKGESEVPESFEPFLWIRLPF